MYKSVVIFRDYSDDGVSPLSVPVGAAIAPAE
jgi:hypothetical protein